jgi:sporulation protein YlmC with PRC-barrel domain
LTTCSHAPSPSAASRRTGNTNSLPATRFSRVRRSRSGRPSDRGGRSTGTLFAARYKEGIPLDGGSSHAEVTREFRRVARDCPARRVRPDHAPRRSAGYQGTRKQGGLFETKDIIGTRIKSVDGKDLGEVDQLLIDRNGKVSYVVIGLGGLAGVGENKVVVPWSDLKFAPVTEGKKNAITMDAAKLEKAPRYDRSARLDTTPAASPRSPVQDSDKDGKSNRTDKAPLDPTKK